MTKEELKELENLKNFKVYVFEWDVYVKAEDFRKKAIECRELREENKRLREELSAYDREYFDEDKKAKYPFMEEDTLQELRDLWVI